jgi:hypothetical protein
MVDPEERLDEVRRAVACPELLARVSQCSHYFYTKI